MKILLADDQALDGWKEILEKILPVNRNDVKTEETVSGVIELVEKEAFDLIFLDLRFGEKDHISNNIEEYGGVEILQSIRSNFDNKNFSTPIILFTATNKIWNVDFMIQNGVDNYYIKEHPDQANDLDFSRKNYQRFKTFIPELIDLNNKRKKVWHKIQNILNSNTIDNANIRTRVEQKLKNGYGILFMNNQEVYKNQLLYSSEYLAFIVFWSVLEEFAKDSFKDNWDRNRGGMRDGMPWETKNGTAFIEPIIRDGESKLRVNIKWDHSNKYYYMGTHEVPDSDNRFRQPNLREQVWAVLLLEKGWGSSDIKSQFYPLRQYRNKIDFIHSSTEAIFNEELAQNQEDKESAYNKTVQMLSFLEKITSH